MWTTLAFVTALSLAAAQNSDLRLTNDRMTYGVLGPVRTEKNFLPGDVYFVKFDIENLQVADDGEVKYSMAMELLNPSGKIQFKNDPQDLRVYNLLGGTKQPAFAKIELALDAAPGEYTLKLTVKDRAAKKTATLEKKFKVVERDFGLVRLGTSFVVYDRAGNAIESPAPHIAVAGQAMVLNCFAVGFKRDSTQKNQPKITVEMKIVDENGKQTTVKPPTGEVDKDIPLDWNLVPLPFELHLNRSGKYTIKLKAIDQISKKTAEVSYPLIVEDPK